MIEKEKKIQEEASKRKKKREVNVHRHFRDRKKRRK
jgi:hypothetical protein